ncbi:hypothetical protein [Rickettsiella endosymbiont of Dermanyssus gallinae]|uniref:hypothetical protein n=1 Tax=Rickettsiella endosymbiont of Dermanyssus gallinae TaxID=2856608 RepID=UPI001C52ED11|nr:hypothetical protein [Rickettsiella endosymbiont of Dermanyssus gallinae]
MQAFLVRLRQQVAPENPTTPPRTAPTAIPGITAGGKAAVTAPTATAPTAVSPTILPVFLKNLAVFINNSVINYSDNNLNFFILINNYNSLINFIYYKLIYYFDK